MIVLRNVDRERNTETLRFNKFCTILNGLVEFIDKGEYYLTKPIDLSMFDYGICKFFNHLNSVYNLDTQGVFGRQIPDGNAIQVGMYEMCVDICHQSFADANDKESMQTRYGILKEIDKIKDNENFWETLHSAEWMHKCISAVCGEQFTSEKIRIVHAIDRVEPFSDFVHCYLEISDFSILDVVKFYKFAIELDEVYREVTSDREKIVSKLIEDGKNPGKFLYYHNMQLYVSHTVVSLSELPVVNNYLEAKYVNTIERIKRVFETGPGMLSQVYDVFFKSLAYRSHDDGWDYAIFSIFVNLLYGVISPTYNGERLSRIESLVFETYLTVEYHNKFTDRIRVESTPTQQKMIDYLVKTYGTYKTTNSTKGGIFDIIEKINNDGDPQAPGLDRTIPFKLEYGEFVRNLYHGDKDILVLVKFHLVPRHRFLTLDLLREYIDYYLALYKYLKTELMLNICESQLCCTFAYSFITEHDDLIKINKELSRLYDEAFDTLCMKAGVNIPTMEYPCSECFDLDVMYKKSDKPSDSEFDKGQLLCSCC